jgi:hypothetical protein
MKALDDNKDLYYGSLIEQRRTTMNKDVIEIIEKIDWISVFAVFNVTKNGKEKKYFGNASNRMLTSSIVSRAIENKSKGNLKYVDAQGWDFETMVGEEKFKIEFKSESNMMYTKPTKKGKNKNKGAIEKEFAKVQLKNLNNINEIVELKSVINTFDILLLADTYGPETFSIGYICQEDITEDMLTKETRGQIIAKIPKDKIKMIITPDYSNGFSFGDSNFGLEKAQHLVFDMFIESCEKNLGVRV